MIREIAPAEFDRIAGELAGVSYQDGGDIEVLSGRHEEHGTVVLIREGLRYVVLAEPADSDGSVMNRAMLATDRKRR